MKAFLAAISDGSCSRASFILGAGASATFGYPLTRGLMLRVMTKLEKASGDAAARALHGFLARLLPGQRTSKDMPSITGILSLIDFALATGQTILPGYTIEQIRGFRRQLDAEIICAIPDDKWFTAEEEVRFDQFQDWVVHVKARCGGRLGMITTNYDMISDLLAIRLAEVAGNFNDWAYRDMAERIDYGFRWVGPDREEITCPRPERPRVSLFKLHGSTNWLRCPLCENIYINPHGPIAQLAADVDVDGDGSADNVCHCSHTRLVPQMVSPSFVRDMREPNLVAVWKAALEFLRESDHWIFLGYSFPPEDIAIRALFTRAMGSRRKPPKVTAVLLDESARENYVSFFPADGFEYLCGGTELLLNCLSSASGRGSKR